MRAELCQLVTTIKYTVISCALPDIHKQSQQTGLLCTRCTLCLGRPATTQHGRVNEVTMCAAGAFIPAPVTVQVSVTEAPTPTKPPQVRMDHAPNNLSVTHMMLGGCVVCTNSPQQSHEMCRGAVKRPKSLAADSGSSNQQSVLSKPCCLCRQTLPRPQSGPPQWAHPPPPCQHPAQA